MKTILSLFLLFFIQGSCWLVAQTGRISVPIAKFRKCADLKCGIIDRLNKGEVMAIIGRGKYERIDSYGKHAWLKVKARNQEGYVFGGVVDILSNPAQEIKFRKTGYIREDKVNVRACAGIQNCTIIAQLKKGTYCKILSKTKQQTTIQLMGTHPWYFVQVGKQRGYVFGALLTIESDQLTINVPKVKVYDYPDTAKGKVLRSAAKGEKYTIKAQSPKSQVIRPHGRHYWYELVAANKSIGWVFGAFTSKSKKVAVNCQCVDYVKKVLAITGPTKNAFEWEDVLQGSIPVTVKGKKVFLNYEEVIDLKKVKKGDIVIFDKLHPDADDLYGHVGIVVEINTIDANTSWVRTESANHKVPLRAYVEKNGCNNVSVKNYIINEYTLFFRPT